MKKQLYIISLLLIFQIISTYTQAQHSISFNFGKKEAPGNMYLSEGASLELGYQYDFAQNFYIRSSAQIYILRQNSNYEFEQEPSIKQEYLWALEPLNEEVFYTAINLKTEIGVIFFKKYRIQPALYAGFSANDIRHRFNNITVYYNNEGLKEGQSVDITDRNQKTGSYQVGAGLFIRLTDKLKLQATAEYIQMPNVKIGIQEKNLTIHSFSAGIIYQLSQIK